MAHGPQRKQLDFGGNADLWATAILCTGRLCLTNSSYTRLHAGNYLLQAVSYRISIRAALAAVLRSPIAFILVFYAFYVYKCISILLCCALTFSNVAPAAGGDGVGWGFAGHIYTLGIGWSVETHLTACPRWFDLWPDLHIPHTTYV